MKIINLLLVIFVIYIHIGCKKCEENNPPKCTITNPLNGTEIELGEIVTISVDASDIDGNDIEVRLSLNSSGIASKDNFPYEYEWDTSTEEIGAYLINATATDNGGSSTSDEISVLIIEKVTNGTVDDYDGNTYNTIKIGNQWWMTENLNTTHFSNGDIIPDGTEAGDITDEIEPLYWFAYNNDLDNVPTYGRLYTWHTVNDTRNVCPDGWHVPSDNEWKDLELTIGMTQFQVDGTGWRGNDGGILKETGTTHWNSPNLGASNTSGFSALPGGRTERNGQYFEIGRYGLWWTSTESESQKAWIRILAFDGNGINRYGLYNKNYGFSVRCVKD